MKFLNKDKQEIIEVLSYEDGPTLYGFEQSGETYLAAKLSEDVQSQAQEWLMIPLNSKDKYGYEEMKAKNISLQEFIRNKNGLIAGFDYLGKQTYEKILTLIPENLIKTYDLSI